MMNKATRQEFRTLLQDMTKKERAQILAFVRKLAARAGENRSLLTGKEKGNH